MSDIKEAIMRGFRGRAASKLLERLGVEPGRFWLLVDLFGLISERGEVLDQLGRNGVALKTVTWMYFGMSALVTLLALLGQPPLAAYFPTCMVVTALMLLSVLLPETANSLLNPVEGEVLAHQPIKGATYTAAKLTHLARIVLYLVPGLNAIPALGGLLLKDAAWYYPVVHLLAALAVGIAAALLCCALFGWLLRFVPARRLKAAAQLVATLPFLAFTWLPQIREWLTRAEIARWLPAQRAARLGVSAALGVLVFAIVALGVRSLSADFLMRASALRHSGKAARTRAGGSWMGGVAARFCGSQSGRAGFAFVSRMMLRDWQFRRQLVPMALVMLIALVPLVLGGWRTDPFSRRFTPLELLPHVFGVLLFFICQLLPYGNDYKGAWIFLLAPERALRGFARGVHAVMWIEILAIPHAAMLLLFAWPWGVWHAALFAGYSLGISSVYLALELRLIDGVPFSQQMDASRGAFLLPVLVAGGLAMAIAVGVQHFLVFRSPAAVALATAGLGAAAYFLTRSSLNSFEVSIRYNLSLISGETGSLYKEVSL